SLIAPSGNQSPLERVLVWITMCKSRTGAHATAGVHYNLAVEERSRMPVYSYACKSCGHAFDIHQDFSDDSLTVCPECQGHLKKVFGTVGISFKGSGFYATDSRASNSSTVGSSRSESSNWTHGSRWRR